MDKQLKAYLDVAKRNSRVLGPVERHLMVRPKDTSRRTDVLHPSDMVSDAWCHRASYFHLKGYPVTENRKVSLTLETVFEEGHAIHARWQNWFAEMGVMYGRWYCEQCKESFWGLASELTHGQSCGPVKYQEVSLNYGPLKIAGHSDGWLVGLGEPLMLEIKSIGMGTLRFECPELLAENGNDFEKTWTAINAPFMKHIMQVQIYMKLAELLGLENCPQEAVLIYEAKPNQKAKEFIVKKSDFGISHLFEQAAMIVKAVEDGVPPQCNISANGCKRCEGYND